MTQIRDTIYVILHVVMVVACCQLMLSSCASSRAPAKHKNNNITDYTQSIPVSQLDQDQDGHISTQEQQLITSPHSHVNSMVAFGAIMFLVIVASVGCAWMGSRCKRVDRAAGVNGGKHTPQAEKEPSAPASEAPSVRGPNDLDKNL